MNALERFHASWPRGVAPSIVEHFAGAADHVAPAMTLWSGAERAGTWLSSAGIEQGDHLGCALPPGIRWVQTFVACQLRGVVFCPMAPGSPPPSGLRALIDEHGALTMKTGRDNAIECVATFSDGSRWSHGDLDAVLAGFGAMPLPRAGARLVTNLPWSSPAGVACAVWLALNSGSELHVGVTDEELHRLGPDVVVSEPGRLADLLDWAPVAGAGLAVLAGPATPADHALATKRGWKLVSLSLRP